jgi:4-hydroxybenzoate polyprenyltransferase
MTSDSYLFIFIVFLLAVTGYLIATNTITDEERDAMLNDEEMWP